MCSAVTDKKCNDGAVCLESGSTVSSFGNAKAMSMDYRHEDDAVILQYGSGDYCPPGERHKDLDLAVNMAVKL